MLGCATNKHQLTEYPRYSDQIAEEMSGSENARKNLVKSEVPNFSTVPGYMAPGYLFHLSHASDAKLAGRYRADFSGILRLPYDVRVDVKGKTFSELRAEVLEAYKKFFQKGVETVNFSISSRDIWVEIRGLVKKPGRYLIRPTDSLDLVINNAEGVQGDINTDFFTASIKQHTFDYKVLLNNYYASGEKNKKIRWFGGDNIFVTKLDNAAAGGQEVPFVTIIGGVNKPGKILHQKDASLYFYIEKAGGVVQDLGYKEAYVFRNTPEGVKKIQFEFDKPETIPVIYANDTIYMNNQVQSAGDTWLMRLSQIAGIISTIALLIIAL